MRVCRRCPQCAGVLKCLRTSNPIHCSSLHGQLSGRGWRGAAGGWEVGGADDAEEACTCERTRGRWRWRAEARRRASRCPPAPPSQTASSPGPGLCGHLPLLMKIHGLISISGVISDTAKHKTGLFPPRPGEPDRMTRLSAPAEEGSCRAWKLGFRWGSLKCRGWWRWGWGRSDGEDLMFGLVTMAAAHYLSGSSPLMRPSAEVEEEVGEGRAVVEVQRRTPTSRTHTHAHARHDIS